MKLTKIAWFANLCTLAALWYCYRGEEWKALAALGLAELSHIRMVLQIRSESGH